MKPFKSPQKVFSSRNNITTRASGNTIKSLSTSKLENIVTKSLQLVQSQSYKNAPSDGGEAIAFPSPTYDTMYSMVLSNSTARPMVMKKRDIAFKEGINIEKTFAEKCIVCGTEYSEPTPATKCMDEKCNGVVREPDLQEKNLISSLLDLKNANGQKLINVLKEISIDHDIVDDGWLVIRNVYQELDGVILSFEPEEFWRVHPGNMAYSMDKTGRIGNYEFTCLFHRDFASQNPLDLCNKNDGDGVCNRRLHSVVAVRMKQQRISMRYIRQEVLHGSEYQPTAIYGYPPALTLWYNLLLTSAQEKFMADYYVQKKFPSAAIFVPTKKRENAVAFKEALDTAVQKDSQARPVFRFDPDAKHKPEIVKMVDSPEEMQFTQVREEARMRMSAFWGVAPMFNSDVQASGGLNNESRQLTIMAWATETKQQALEEHYLEPLLEMLNISDWRLELGKIEEEDEASSVSLEISKAQLAQTMMSLGFDVNKDEDGNFVYEKSKGGFDLNSSPMELDLNAYQSYRLNSDNSEQLESLKSKAETFDDYPESAVNNAKKALKWRDEYGRDVVQGATRVGWARANQLANKEKISEETIRRMASFNRHRKNAEVDPKYKDEPWRDNGYVAWLTWGGTSGVNWAIEKSKTLEKKTKTKSVQDCVSEKIPIIKDENPNMEMDQVIAISYSYCKSNHDHKSKNIIRLEDLLYSILGREDDKNYRPPNYTEKAKDDIKFGYYDFTDDLGDWDWKDDYELVDYQNVPLETITVNEDFMIRDSDIEKGSERVRPLTIIRYLNDKEEMKPLITDMNYNLLDGHHRYYCCDKKDQMMVRVARVEQKREVKQKAPKGGITYKGVFYKGGSFLPKDYSD